MRFSVKGMHHRVERIVNVAHIFGGGGAGGALLLEGGGLGDEIRSGGGEAFGKLGGAGGPGVVGFGEGHEVLGFGAARGDPLALFAVPDRVKGAVKGFEGFGHVAVLAVAFVFAMVFAVLAMVFAVFAMMLIMVFAVLAAFAVLALLSGFGVASAGGGVEGKHGRKDKALHRGFLIPCGRRPAVRGDHDALVAGQARFGNRILWG